MNIRSQLWSIAIGLGTLYAIGYGAYLLFATTIDKLNSINSDVSKTVIAGGFALVGTVITLVAGKLWEQHIKIRQEVREKKIPVYEQQITTFFNAMFAQKKGLTPMSEPELQKAFAEFTEKLIVWGSSEVIQSWQQFRTHDWQNGTPVQAFMQLESFLKTLRKDIGNENKHLKDGDLLRLFITDFDAVIATNTQQSQASQSIA